MDCELPNDNASSAEIAEILRKNKSIAVVGLSPNPNRPSHSIAAYLLDQGYRVIPVNPGHQEILGEPCYKSLLEIPEPVEVVNIFRQPDAVPEIVDQAIQVGAKVVWMQTGIVHNAAADKARAAGLHVVMNKCIWQEHRRLRE